ncbi:SET and MYND domain-containing protein (SMYD)-like protein, partial [Leptotrombidium deliense]
MFENGIFDVSNFSVSLLNYLKELQGSKFQQVLENYGKKFDLFDSKIHQKCSQKSIDYRLKDCKYKEALESYNQAIIFAPYESEDQCLAISFANRSAALFYLEQFKECLQDIEYALYFKCPQKIAEKLMKRKAKCIENTEKSCRKSDSIEFNVNLKIYGVSNCVEIASNLETGRSLKVNRNVLKGELLVVQKPFASVLTPSRYNTNCYFCLRSLCKHIQYPCSNCTQVFFCNRNCYSECWQKYHKYECCRLELLNFSKDFHLQPKLALIILLSAGFENVFDAIQNDKNTKIDFSSLNYAAINSLMDHSDSCVDFTPSCNLMLLFLSKVFPQLSNDKIALLGCVILKHIQQIHVNGKYIYERTTKNTHASIETLQDTKIGCALYQTFSLLNHSCKPNALTYIFDGHILYVKALRNMNAGEEILISYGSNCKWQNTLERRSFLKKYYFFNCECWACVNDLNPKSKAVLCELCSGTAVLTTTHINCLDCKTVSANVEHIATKLQD